MSARDANDATWFTLRYAEDFPSSALIEVLPGGPRARLFYDEARHVLELLPRTPEEPTPPPPGLAVDVDGEVYRVDPATGRLLVRRCDGSEVPLVCVPGVFAEPAGLAIDRRGFLYVADPGACRVVVVLPDDGRVSDVLGGLRLPVDVATSPRGTIYVADALAGEIVSFDARHVRLRSFPACNGEGQPARAVPVAVMVDADETLLVSDASHPRLLRFTPAGEPLADVSLAVLVGALAGGDVALEALEKAYGTRLHRFFAGACAPPLPERDGGRRLAEVHRALRLLMLRLGRSFETEGVFLSRVFDSGRPGTTWHRIELNADLPDGTALTVETATAESPANLLPPTASKWNAPPDAEGRPIPFTPIVPDQLIQSPPGRYLRLRMSLRSDGGATPSVRSLRVLYPRVSYLDLLPRIYRRDPEGSAFLERFLALFERVLTGIEDRYDGFSRLLNPDAAPREVIDWLACLIDLSFDPSWPVERRRALVAAAMDLYRRRGTVDGLARYIEIYTGIRPQIQEHFLARPRRPTLLGGSVLGCSLTLAPVRPETRPDEQLYRDFAHRFTVLLYLADACDAEATLPVVERIVAVNRPAHTAFVVRPIYPEARVGLQATVGLDLVLGGREAAGTRIGGDLATGVARPWAAVLGRDAVLGPERPQYVRPIEPVL